MEIKVTQKSIVDSVRRKIFTKIRFFSTEINLSTSSQYSLSKNQFLTLLF